MKGGDLTPIYELVVAMLARGERFPNSIQLGDWGLVYLKYLNAICVFYQFHYRPIHFHIREDSALGRAILAAW